MANGMTVGASRRHRAPGPEAREHPDQQQGLLKIVDSRRAAQREGDTQLPRRATSSVRRIHGPEQILGKKVDERRNIYSIGVIMYEMFTGQPPYSRGDHNVGHVPACAGQGAPAEGNAGDGAAGRGDS